MKKKRDAQVDVTALLDALRALALQGLTRVRAAKLSRESDAAGHYVPKKFVRLRLSVDTDGMTGIPGVTITEEPQGRYWFCLSVILGTRVGAPA
jgi:hypothetical protein